MRLASALPYITGVGVLRTPTIDRTRLRAPPCVSVTPCLRVKPFAPYTSAHSRSGQRTTDEDDLTDLPGLAVAPGDFLP